MYGTIAGVKAKAKQYTQIAGRETGYLDNEITTALTEASLFADHILVKRYDLSVIQASVPAIVTEYAELRAYIILLTHLSQVDVSTPDSTIAQVMKRISFIEDIYFNGDLLDNSSNIIDYNIISTLYTQPDVWQSEVEA